MKHTWISTISVQNGLLQLKEDLRGVEMEVQLVQDKISFSIVLVSKSCWQNSQVQFPC